MSNVHHPAHYGGADNPYETIKVIEAWQLNFNLGNSVKYISRAHRKGARVEDLEKARWYLDREISTLRASSSGSSSAAASIARPARRSKRSRNRATVRSRKRSAR